MSRETKHRPALQNWIRFENRKKKRNGKVGKSGMGRRKNLENRFARIVFRSSPDSNLCAIISFFERGKKFPFPAYGATKGNLCINLKIFCFKERPTLKYSSLPFFEISFLNRSSPGNFWLRAYTLRQSRQKSVTKFVNISHRFSLPQKGSSNRYWPLHNN